MALNHWPDVAHQFAISIVRNSFYVKKVRKHGSCLYMTTYDHSNGWITLSFSLNQGMKVLKYQDHPMYVNVSSLLFKTCTECVDYLADFS